MLVLKIASFLCSQRLQHPPIRISMKKAGEHLSIILSHAMYVKIHVPFKSNCPHKLWLKLHPKNR
jgi:hypothetical protein